MIGLTLAATTFVLIHLLISGTRLRDIITGRIGVGPYMGLFSLASLGVIVWMSMAYGGARADAANLVFWGAAPAAKMVQLALTLAAFLLIVPGLLTPNPTSVRQEGALDRPDAVKGMLWITRHPFLWGVALWAAGHLLVNGDLASFVLFGAMLALAVLGTSSIDAKRKRALGEKWDAFAAQTSNAPFGAILTGRQKLNIGEIGWRLIVGVVVWAAVLATHRMAFGVSPLP